MNYLFDHNAPMTRRSNHTSERVLLAALIIATGWLSTARANIADLPRAGGSIDTAGTTALQSAQIDSLVNASTSPDIPDVAGTTPAPPAAQELAADSLYQFIVHHATVHFANTGTERNLARWRARAVRPAVQKQRADTVYQESQTKHG